MEEPKIIDTELRNKNFRFKTTWGLFSPKEIDYGSRLLIENVNPAPDSDILDLGCGYGVIGIALAKGGRGELHMVDKDFVAVEYANLNAKENGLKNCKVYLSNGFSKVPSEQKFDIIASNIPAKVGKELLQIMISDAKKHLKPGGRFYVVTIAGLKDFMKRHLKNRFGNYKKIKQSRGYVVAMAEKTENK